MNMVKASIPVIVLIILVGCIFNSQETPISIKAITSNKTLYKSNDDMYVNITLESTDFIERVFVNITGLKNSLGEILLNKSKIVNPQVGENEIVFHYITPTCSPCKHLDPGSYEIYIKVSYEGKVLAEGSKTIELSQ